MELQIRVAKPQTTTADAKSCSIDIQSEAAVESLPLPSDQDIWFNAKYYLSLTCQYLAIFSSPVIIKILALCLYMAYFFYAMARCLMPQQCAVLSTDFWTLVAITSFGLGIPFLKISNYVIRKKFETHLAKLNNKFITWKVNISESHYASPRLIWIGLPSIFALFVLIDSMAIRHNFYSLVSLAGVCFILSFVYASSANRTAFKPRPTIVGLTVQVCFAFFVLRVPLGERLFKWLGDVVSNFLANSQIGAAFVWRTAFTSQDFAFAILPIIPFFGAVTSVLYYLGWIQVLIKVLSTFMEKFMGTTAGESTSCSANIFLSMNEAPLLIKPYIRYMTRSELYAVLTGGYATIAGSVMGAYIALKVEPRDLLAASVMAAPGALALSKLAYPETERSRMTAKDMKKLAERQRERRESLNADEHAPKPHNILEAACEGASNSIPMVAGIVVNLIAMISILSFLNNLISWLGDRVGLAPPDIEEPLSLEFIASYLFWPIALLLGVPVQDCRNVGKLLGVKIFTNEFVAYMKMSQMISARESYERYTCQYVHHQNIAPPMLNLTGYDNVLGSESFQIEMSSFNVTSLVPILLHNGSFVLPATNETLVPFMTRRAQALTTYALCGFSNLGSAAIQMGTMSAMAPSKKTTIATMAFASMITGTCVNLLNAALAGMLLSFDEPTWDELCKT